MQLNSSFYSVQLYDVKEIILEQKNCRWHMTTIKLIIIILILKRHFFLRRRTIISLLKVNTILKIRYTMNYNLHATTGYNWM